jgi:ubiquitin-protein ligase
MSSPRENRLRADHKLLTALDEASSILSLEPSGDPPDRYTLTLRGKGLGRDAGSQSEVTIIELHQIDVRMPYAYPQSPPDIRWITPILHPNVSFSGFVNLADVGIMWTSEVPIDLVCERLWDVARGEFINLDKATNYAAKNWFEKENRRPLPVDSRPLRDRSAGSTSNVIRYERRAGGGVGLVGGAAEVMFIDENTPTPQMPARRPIPRPRPAGGDDVIYIGPE